jgi:alpha-beta hydrolase superfamily lysophospholipase
MMRGATIPSVVAGLIALFTFCGCRDHWTSMMVTAPNHGVAASTLVQKDRSIRRPEGIGFLGRRVQAADGIWLWVRSFMPDTDCPRGTVVLLHGIHSHGGELLHVARQFRDAGYHVAVPDLRGHGRSSGDWVTFGVRESVDLSILIDELETAGRLFRPLIVLGHSLGAAAALLCAADDRRVDALVLSGCYTSMREVVPATAQHVAPLVMAVHGQDIQSMITSAAVKAGFVPEMASPLRAAPRVQVPVLLVHGAEDRFTPPDHSRQLKEAMGGPVELVLISGADHNDPVLDARESRKTIEIILAWLESAAQRSGRHGAVGRQGHPLGVNAKRQVDVLQPFQGLLGEEFRAEIELKRGRVG